MAKEESTATAAPPKKHFPSILDDKGQTKQVSLQALNKRANGLMFGKQKRHANILKNVTDAVKQQLKRA
jgi:hypothetical protein